MTGSPYPFQTAQNLLIGESPYRAAGRREETPSFKFNEDKYSGLA